jgi:hypothetical protein
MNPETTTLYVMPVREIIAILASSADDRPSPAARLSRRRRQLQDEVSATVRTDRRVP